MTTTTNTQYQAVYVYPDGSHDAEDWYETEAEAREGYRNLLSYLPESNHEFYKLIKITVTVTREEEVIS